MSYHRSAGQNHNNNNNKGKVVPVLSQALRHDDVLGEWRYSSTPFRNMKLKCLGITVTNRNYIHKEL